MGAISGSHELPKGCPRFFCTLSRSIATDLTIFFKRCEGILETPSRRFSFLDSTAEQEWGRIERTGERLLAEKKLSGFEIKQLRSS
jgi:hypothetical protein